MNIARTRRRGWPTPNRTGRVGPEPAGRPAVEGRGAAGRVPEPRVVPLRRVPPALGAGLGAGLADRDGRAVPGGTGASGAAAWRAGPGAAVRGAAVRGAPVRAAPPRAAGVLAALADEEPPASDAVRGLRRGCCAAPAERARAAARCGSRSAPRPRRGPGSLTRPKGGRGRPACPGTASRVHLVVAGVVLSTAPDWSVVLGAAPPAVVPPAAEAPEPDGVCVCETTVKPSPAVAFFATPTTLPSDRRRNAALGGGHHPHLHGTPGQVRRRLLRGQLLGQRVLGVGQLTGGGLEVVQGEGAAAHRDVDQQQAEQAGREQRDARDGERGSQRTPGGCGCRERPADRGRVPGDVPWSGGSVTALSSGSCVLSLRGSGAFGGPQPGGGGAGVHRRLSSALGSSAPRVSSRRYGACSGSSTGRPGGVVLRAPRGEQLLGQPVLQRVVAEDGDPAADGERVDRGREAALQAASSPLTSIRSAWKVRLAGWPPLFCDAAGMASRSSSTRRAEVVKGSCCALPDDRRRRSRRANRSSPYSRRIRVELGGVVGVEDVGRGDAARSGPSACPAARRGGRRSPGRPRPAAARRRRGRRARRRPSAGPGRRGRRAARRTPRAPG